MIEHVFILYKNENKLCMYLKYDLLEEKWVKKHYYYSAG